LKIFKFGGSSVQDATAMKRVSEIILNHSNCGIVVVSATKNTTNELEQIAKSASLNEVNLMQKQLESLTLRHRAIADDLELDIGLSLSELESELQMCSQSILGDGEILPKKMDALYSLGERFSSLILSSYLSIQHDRAILLKDIREIMITNDSWSCASPLIGEISQRVQLWKPVVEDALIVTQGFIGSTLSGETTTLGREGSDYSATLLGEAFSASEVFIWTDVAGVATCDPRIVPSAKFIEQLSYDHASRLAQFGAKVLFERTLEPAMRAKFPVVVKSTLLPSEVGSRIFDLPKRDGVVGLALEGDILSIIGENLLSEEVSILNNLSDYEIYKQTDEYIALRILSEDIEDFVREVHSKIL